MANLIPRRKAGDGWLTRTGEHPLDRLRDEMEQMFDRYFGGWPALFEGGWGRERFWDVNMDETDKEVVVRAEAPGFEPGEFDVDVRGDMLTIRAEHKEQEGKEKEETPRQWGYRRFERSFTLPAAVDANKVEARYRNGVLEVHLPRT